MFGSYPDQWKKTSPSWNFVQSCLVLLYFLFYFIIFYLISSVFHFCSFGPLTIRCLPFSELGNFFFVSVPSFLSLPFDVRAQWFIYHLRYQAWFSGNLLPKNISNFFSFSCFSRIKRKGITLYPTQILVTIIKLYLTIACYITQWTITSLTHCHCHCHCHCQWILDPSGTLLGPKPSTYKKKETLQLVHTARTVVGTIFILVQSRRCTRSCESNSKASPPRSPFHLLFSGSPTQTGKLRIFLLTKSLKRTGITLRNNFPSHFSCPIYVFGWQGTEKSLLFIPHWPPLIIPHIATCSLKV